MPSPEVASALPIPTVPPTPRGVNWQYAALWWEWLHDPDRFSRVPMVAWGTLVSPALMARLGPIIAEFRGFHGGWLKERHKLDYELGRNLPFNHWVQTLPSGAAFFACSGNPFDCNIDPREMVNAQEQLQVAAWLRKRFREAGIL